MFNNDQILAKTRQEIVKSIISSVVNGESEDIHTTEEEFQKAIETHNLEVYPEANYLQFRKDLRDKFFSNQVTNEEIEKARKDISKLKKVFITDKNGDRRTVYVKQGETPVEKKGYKSHTKDDVDEIKATIARQKALLSNPKSPVGAKRRAQEIIAQEEKKLARIEKKAPIDEPSAKQEAKEHSATHEKIKQDVKQDGKLDMTKKELGESIREDHENRKDSDLKLDWDKGFGNTYIAEYNGRSYVFNQDDGEVAEMTEDDMGRGSGFEKRAKSLKEAEKLIVERVTIEDFSNYRDEDNNVVLEMNHDGGEHIRFSEIYPKAYGKMLCKQLGVNNIDELVTFLGNDKVEEISDVADLGINANKILDLSKKADYKGFEVGAVDLMESKGGVRFITEQNASPIIIYMRKKDWGRFKKEMSSENTSKKKTIIHPVYGEIPAEDNGINDNWSDNVVAKYFSLGKEQEMKIRADGIFDGEGKLAARSLKELKQKWSWPGARIRFNPDLSKMDLSKIKTKIHAHGFKGERLEPWKKTFSSVDEMNNWAKENEADIHDYKEQ